MHLQQSSQTELCIGAGVSYAKEWSGLGEKWAVWSRERPCPLEGLPLSAPPSVATWKWPSECFFFFEEKQERNLDFYASSIQWTKKEKKGKEREKGRGESGEEAGEGREGEITQDTQTCRRNLFSLWIMFASSFLGVIKSYHNGLPLLLKTFTPHSKPPSNYIF